MKSIIFYILLLTWFSSFSQNDTKQFIKKYETTAQGKKEGLLFDYLSSISADKDFFKKESCLLSYFEDTHQNTATAVVQLQLSDRFRTQGDYANSIKYSLDALQIYEKTKDIRHQLNVKEWIAARYDESNNFKQSQHYYRQLISQAKKSKSLNYYADGLNGLGSLYSRYKRNDSASYYARLGLDKALQLKDTLRVYVALSTLGESYLAQGKNALARPILKKSLDLALLKSDLYVAMCVTNDFAQSFASQSPNDSVAFFANKTLKYSRQFKFPTEKLRALQYLSDYYEKQQKSDSSNRYFRLATSLKDSLFGATKSKEMQTVIFREQLRQQQLELQKEKEEMEHNHMVQYAAIAVGLFTIIIIVLIITNTLLVSQKWIEFLSVLTLLVFFEFINLIIHPYIATMTNENPLIMLAIMVSLASLLIPLHHKIEKLAVTKLIEKNKKVRLAKSNNEDTDESE